MRCSGPGPCTRSPAAAATCDKTRFIPYFPTLPARGEYSLISSSEYFRLFNCRHCEGICTGGEEEKNELPSVSSGESHFGVTSLIRLGLLSDSLVRNISRDFWLFCDCSPPPGLAIRKISQEFGHALFATKFIRRGTFLGLFSGRLMRSPFVSDYRMGDIDPLDTGGLSRFLQHLPGDKEEEKEFKRFSLMRPEIFALEHGITVEEARNRLAKPSNVDRLRDSIERQRPDDLDDLKLFNLDAAFSKPIQKRFECSFATANVARLSGSAVSQLSAVLKAGGEAAWRGSKNPLVSRSEEFEFDVLVASKEIFPGEIVGISYGFRYWKARLADFPYGPTLFTRQGEILDRKGNYSWEWAKQEQEGGELFHHRYARQTGQISLPEKFLCARAT